MKAALDYIRALVGNGAAATIGIFAFIFILCLMFSRCATAAEVQVGAGSSFGTEGYGATLGFEVKHALPSNPGVSVFAGTDLWGATTHNAKIVPNNFDWHAGIEACKWRFCAYIGPAFVQRVDAINGAHTNFHLGFEFKLTNRLSLNVAHISDAGTSSPNIGRQALLLEYKLQ